MSEEESSVILLDSDDDVTDSTEQEGKDGDGDIISSSVELLESFPDPKSLRALLNLPGLFQLLAKSVVFIQNRKASSDQLLYSVSNFWGNSVELDFLQTHSKKPLAILRQIRNGKSQRPKPKVLVVDITGTVGSINKFCTDIILANRNGQGVWIRGYVRDLSPKVITLFDALFAFDMSEREYEILRTSIAINKEMISEIKDCINHGNAGGMLFFLNQGRVEGAPLMARNPTVIHCSMEDFMDPNWILVAVEVGRFLFDDLKKWLGVGVSTLQAPEATSQFQALCKEEFEQLIGNKDELVKTVDEAALGANVYRIQGLRDQIVVHIKNLTDYESQQAEMGIATLPYVKRGIENESKAIATKAKELQVLLSVVFRRDMQV